MKKLILLAATVFSSVALAKAELGKPAPDFTLKGSDGKTYKLSDITKKHDTVVVLEWFNEGCPYVKKHYESGNMQRLQQEATAKGVKWFSIASSAKSKQGYLATPADAKKVADAKGMKNTAILLDGTQATARAYEAKTTPHMFVINKNGLIAYNGAIDSNSSSDKIDLTKYVSDASVKKYVEEAVTVALNNPDAKVKGEEPYGCSVKY